jgi:ankyrin repeat protein
MFNRLNRNTALATVLGSVTLLVVGCGDSNNTAGTGTTTTAQTPAESSAPPSRPETLRQAAPDPAVVRSTEDEEAKPAPAPTGPSQEELRARAEDVIANLDPAVREQIARELRGGGPDLGDHAGGLPTQVQPEGSDEDRIFSPSASFREFAEASGEDLPTPVDPTVVRVRVTPELLDLGQMATNDTQSGTMTLKNISDIPVMIENSRTSCGCTVANVPRGQYLQPGESVDVEVSLRSSARPEVLSKTVTFVIRDHPPITARVRGQAISFVEIQPAILNPETMPEAAVVISANDGEAFRVTSMHPQIALGGLSDEPATSHKIDISWENWRELGEARRVLFYTDHPKAAQVMATVRAPVRPREDLHGDRPGLEPPQPTGPNPVVLVQRGQTEEVLKLIAEGEIDVNVRDRSGAPLIGIAARHGNLDVVDALIEAGADINAVDNTRRTPLMTASQSRHAAIVERLVKAGADLEAVDNAIGGTALTWAALGDPASVKVLIDAGANVNVQTGTTGYSPLIWAAGFGQGESVAHLIKAGAALETADHSDRATALMHAARAGRNDSVELLVKAGAKLEAKDRTGKTPLLWAAGSSSANVETVKFLVEAGADLSARDNAGQTALDHAGGRADPNADAVRAYLQSVMGD